MEKLMKFREMGLSENILNALESKGFEEPTPIQEQTIPLLLSGEKDLVGQAQTGTGKTAAFGIPIIERISENTAKIEALILTPTRELALQVSDEIHSLKGKKKIKVLPVYGGQGIDIQIRNLKKGGVNIVVGTPGRIIDHINRGTLELSHLKFVILDEADEMLNMGFIDEVQKILSNTPEEKQVLLFSATMPREIMNIAKKYMKDHQVIKVKNENITADLTEQIYFEVNERDKFEALCRILDIENDFYGIIFCRTKLDVDNVASKLSERGYAAEAIHGDITQIQREKVLNRFKAKKLNVLVATDVAARGIDVNDLTHVINYSLPQDPECYVHRIGRTGRAGKEGTAITFVTNEEYRKLLYIQKVAKTDIKKQDIPEIDEVIMAKKTRIKEDIQTIITTNSFNEYLELARELLDSAGNAEVVASVLKYSLEDELDERNYSEIRKVNVNKAGKSRLFVALGKVDNMTPGKLLDMIKEQVNVDARQIREIRIFDNFSFLTAPFEEAELILEAFKTRRGGKKPIIARAKDAKRN
jgi:ATP-dependent RNA helicase DeaD